LVIRAVSPDGNITAEVRDRDQVDLRFAAGAFRSYDAARLANQLDQLAALTWVRHRRECVEVVALMHGKPADPRDARAEDEVFRHGLEQLTLTGASADGIVSVRSRGLVRWQFQLHGDIPAAVPERAFTAAVRSAVDAVLADHRSQVVLLRDEVYGLGIPAWMRTGG
jgi:hypothetical protein